MKFSLQAVLKVNELISSHINKPLTGLFYGTDVLTTDFVQCQLNANAMILADQSQLKRNLSILRTGVFVFNSTYEQIKGEQFSQNAKIVTFDLKNAEKGLNGLMCDNQDIELEISQQEQNCLRLMLADESGSGLLECI